MIEALGMVVFLALCVGPFVSVAVVIGDDWSAGW